MKTYPMKTRQQARAWVYRHCVAFSLRKKAAALTADWLPGKPTAAGVERVRAEMLRLAEWPEGKAAKIEAKTLEGLL